MKYRQLGSTGIEVSEIGAGTSTISGQGTYGAVDEADGITAVLRAYEKGVTFFDTAQGYAEGRSEEALGKALGNKQDVVICTKVGGRAGPFTAESIRAAAEASLRRLQRDAIDVYLLHNPAIEQISDPAVKEALESLKADGLVRSYGVSCVTRVAVEQGEEVIRQGGYTSMQVPLNIFQQQVVDGLLPHAQKAGVGIIARVPLASGLLTGKYTKETVFPENDGRATGTIPREQLEREFEKLPALMEQASNDGVPLVHAALAWVLSHGGVSTVIAGVKNAAQAESNASASGVTLSAAFLELTRTL